MAIKVEQITQTQPVEAPQAADRSDGSFKFTLASHIEESELQEKLSGMMSDITEQGEKLKWSTDHINFPEKIFWTEEDATEFTAL